MLYFTVERHHLYRVVDRAGKTVDFHLSAKWDVAAAKVLFAKAVKSQGTPQIIALDDYAASHRALAQTPMKLPRQPSVVIEHGEADVVSTDRGEVGGIRSVGLRRFLGIPYTVPHVGELRWKAPQDSAVWTGRRDATR